MNVSNLSEIHSRLDTLRQGRVYRWIMHVEAFSFNAFIASYPHIHFTIDTVDGNEKLLRGIAVHVNYMQYIHMNRRGKICIDPNEDVQAIRRYFDTKNIVVERRGDHVYVIFGSAL